MTPIIPIILAGGNGTRLWPLSRKSYPKQFSKLLGEESLFQQTAQRLTSSAQVQFNKPIIATHSDFRFLIREQLQNIDLEPSQILIEPEAKNTAAAILASTICAIRSNPDAVILVAPADHLIPDTSEFHRAIALGLEETAKGNIVTFGIPPSKAETQFGYLEIGKKITDQPTPLKSFVEKPNSVEATKMYQNKKYLWNAGIFMARAKDMIIAFENHSKNLMIPVRAALNEGLMDLGFFRLDPEAWSKCQSISIDYAVMEKADNLFVVPYGGEWSDLGGWQSVGQHMEFDENGVCLSKNAHALECKNSVLRSENDTLELVGVGLENIIAVAMPDAVLIAQRDQAHKVKDVVTMLKSNAVKQAEIFPKDHRPWGWFETLATQNRFQVKRIMVNPGAALSLQSHHHRSEHWVVVEGTARVTIDDQIKLITEGQSIYVPLGAHHRLENPGKMPMVLIEIQTGAYLGEDDITRYHDDYNRG